MRVHTFIHQYQYRYTNTEGYDDASIMCGDFYTLTTSKVSTWAVPATRPMETSFRQIIPAKDPNRLCFSSLNENIIKKEEEEQEEKQEEKI